MKRKKESRKRLVKALDRAFSNFIIARDGSCVICSKQENLAAGHLISRSCYAVRWDPRNAHVQCRGCNLLHEFRPERFTIWFLNQYGLDIYKELCADSRIQSKISNTRLKELTEMYGLRMQQK